MKKDTNLSVRISSENLETIKQKVKQAKLSQSNYVTKCCLGKQIVIIDGVKPLLSELHKVGNNLNQLVTLANMNRICTVNLEETQQAFTQISKDIKSILEKERW
ncbi:MAG: plasmid mobilization relaxosome protein MobC [Clostridia bacterium]